MADIWGYAAAFYQGWSNGFKAEFRDGSNQVQHFSAGVMAGFQYGYWGGLLHRIVRPDGQRSELRHGGRTGRDRYVSRRGEVQDRKVRLRQGVWCLQRRKRPMNRIRVHLIYCAIVAVLLTAVAARYVPPMLESSATIPDRDDKSRYTLRMLAGGNLIFERNRLLPLASHSDYWGDMSVSTTTWTNDGQVLITMSDGTRLRITLGRIEIESARKAQSGPR
jgi:hypothetical protein